MGKTTESSRINGEVREDFSFRGVKVCVTSCKCAEKYDAEQERFIKTKIEKMLSELERLDVGVEKTGVFRASFVIGSTGRVMNFVYDEKFLKDYKLRDPQILILMADGNQQISLCELAYLADHLDRAERCIAMHAMQAKLDREAPQEGLVK